MNTYIINRIGMKRKVCPVLLRYYISYILVCILAMYFKSQAMVAVGKGYTVMQSRLGWSKKTFLTKIGVCVCVGGVFKNDTYLVIINEYLFFNLLVIPRSFLKRLN